MFVDIQDHYDYINNCLNGEPSRIIITTFGIYAGITSSGQDSTTWGPNYAIATKSILDRIDQLGGGEVLVGVPTYRSCRDQTRCMDCERNYAKSIIRLMFHADAFSNIKWKVTTDLHLKCLLFFYDKHQSVLAKGIAGGRNFTDSDWADATFELLPYQIDVLVQHVDQLWKCGVDLVSANMQALMNEQGISEKAILSLLES